MPKKKPAPAPQKKKTPEVVEKPEEAGDGAAATTATGSSPVAAPADVDLELGELPEAARKAFAELNLKIDNIDTDEMLHAQALYEYKAKRLAATASARGSEATKEAALQAEIDRLSRRRWSTPSRCWPRLTPSWRQQKKGLHCRTQKLAP